LGNLTAFLHAVPDVLEVSIGHALIADALEFGLGEAVRKYLDASGGVARDSRNRNRSVRNLAHRKGARAVRRTFRPENTGGLRIGGLSAPAPAGGVPRQALRREGGLLEGPGNRNPFPGELAQRLGRQRPLGQARARVLAGAGGAAQAARDRESPRLA